MRYLCLIYLEDEAWRQPAPGELEACREEQLRCRARLLASGRGLAAHSLQPPETASCVRVRDGALALAAGPHPATSAQLGGFFLLEATDLNEALRLAAQIPLARRGCVEVRPLV